MAEKTVSLHEILLRTTFLDLEHPGLFKPAESIP
jgi:hypothetical protein